MRGFARVSAAVPVCRVADVAGNVERTLALFEASHAEGDALVVFPELGFTGYTARDLFGDRNLLERVLEGLDAFVERSAELDPLALVGMPLRHGAGLYNCAVAVQRGRILGIVPKAYLPDYREFEESRWFRSGRELAPGLTLPVRGEEVPFGSDLLFEARGSALVVGIEVCEDLWVQLPPSMFQASAGATVIANLSASNFTIGKAELRRLLARSASDRGKCAYVYVAAGPGESSTDLAFDADAFICENGHVVAASQRFARHSQRVTFDVDLEALVHDRVRTTTFADCAHAHARPFRRIPFGAQAGVSRPLRRTVSRHPFVPTDPAELSARCFEIFEIQSHALATRMQALGRPKLVLGLSGGLDSTHAALVAASALDLLDRPRSELECVTLPGLGTTAGTRRNAERLAHALAATFRELPIAEASHTLLALVGHPAATATSDASELLTRVRGRPELGDVTFENVQARLRTLVLMTLANADGGIVIGTGDLSEKALGWSTYAGDHISMYDVNAGVPKTLIQSVVRWVASERAPTWSKGDPEELRHTLEAILDTPISPELLPADAEGRIAQHSESTLGPYVLHDFFLYHFVRHGASPRRILDLATVAFEGHYELPALKHWLRVFLRRFFTQQFKRSCTADGPKVGQVALSPRADWRMPSDASVDEWLAEVDAYRGLER